MALDTDHHTKSVQEFVDLYRQKRLNLAPAFQRQSVWSTRDRRLLVNSVFDSIPLPSIYLYMQVGKGGQPMFDVIDGKQRLETLLFFIGIGPLAKQDDLWVRRSFSDNEPLEWWLWKHLDDEQRNSFLTARLPTIEVKGDLGEIIELFVRINATGKRLTAQEQRHARFYTSAVLRAAQRLADEQAGFLVGSGVVSQGQLQRMKHVELLTELLLAVRAGMPLNKKSKIDEVIRGDGLTPGELTDAAAAVRRALKVVGAILPHLKTTRFSQVTDFYSLALLVARYHDEGKAMTSAHSPRNRLAGGLLTDFGRGVDEVNELVSRGAGVKQYQEPFRQYLMTVKEGTDTRKQRELRENLLRTVLHGVFDDKDPSRTFNATQRRILWHASAKKTCSICKRPIDRWEDMSIDHVIAYIKGGKTNLANAALAHKSCNSRKGAR
jgi:hypothetical protein